jgi:hypothetical protein
VKITTAALYPANSRIPVTTVRLRDNKIQRHQQLADAEGRLHFEFEGDEVQVKIGAGLVERSIKTTKLPSAPLSTDFQIADHRTFRVFQHATQQQTMTLGQGNGDGFVNAGEQIAVLFPDGNAFRAAELIGDSDCVDLTTRVSDYWGDYDYVGASAKYTLAKIGLYCPGRTIKLFARVIFPNKPNHQLREFTIELHVVKFH